MPPIRTKSSRTSQPNNFIGIGYTLPSATTDDNVEALVEDFLNACISKAQPSSGEVSDHGHRCQWKLVQRKRAREAVAARTAEAKGKAPKGVGKRMREEMKKNQEHRKHFGGRLQDSQRAVKRRDSFDLQSSLNGPVPEDGMRMEISGLALKRATEAILAPQYWDTPASVTQSTPELTEEQMVRVLAREQQRDDEHRSRGSGREARKMARREPYNLTQCKAQACLRQASKLGESVNSPEIVEDEMCEEMEKMVLANGLKEVAMI